MLPVLYPMKASDDEKRTELAWNNERYICEEKYDGVRFLIRKEFDGNVRITSRVKSKKTGLPTEKQENFPHLVEWAKQLPNGTVIDGEVIVGGNSTSSEVTKITGALPQKAISRQKKNGWVNYVAYDILYYDGENVMDKPWSERRALLESVVVKLWSHKHVHVSKFVHCHKNNNKSREFYNKIVADGGEGVILKDTQATYKPDKRPLGTWLKVKKYSTYDVVVMGFTDAEVEYTGKNIGNWKYWQDEYGRKWRFSGLERAKKFSNDNGIVIKPITKYHHNGWIGSIIFGQYNNKGELIEVGQTSGMDEETRAWFTENKTTSIGLVIEVGAMERIPETNALRHPVYLRIRDDKQPEECIIGEC
ncbi:hypothetical protein QB910_000109 [Dabrowskivirus KKP3916]|uniref:DNA ligase n=1 Tax=Alicyclobacillus phage KKP_3916 TaxID=3040651 RepID=A0AAT9V7U2_9CAUD|nr:hypothetical protein QB910_000109 [Alicyclobacillus phage KKP 3916]